MKPIRLALFALGLGVVTFGAFAQGAGDPPCRGTWVRSLAGPHAVTRPPMADVAALVQRLPELEPALRAAIAADPTLGPGVADALIATLRARSGITERPFRRTETVRWMAYQPKPGQFDLIEPACLRLRRDYDAFEITVEVPEPAPAAAAPTCAITATRSCSPTDPTFSVDIRGSSPGARVTLAAGDRPPAAVGGAGESWTVPDPGPTDLDAVFTVRSQPAPSPPRSARVYRFLMPKVCGNLTYLGEAARRTLPASGPAPAGCEKSVRLARCAPAVAETPPSVPPIPPPVEVAECEAWIARPFAFGFFPTGDAQERDILIPSGPARERFELKDGFGLGGSFERRFGPVIGLEAAAMFGRGTSKYELADATESGEDSHRANFYAFTLGPNFHLLGCDGVDLYVGPFIGYGGFADPNYWALDHHFAATFDGDFIWGAQLGLDVPFGTGPWGFHSGLRYIELDQETDAGTLTVDPLIVELGLAYRF